MTKEIWVDVIQSKDIPEQVRGIPTNYQCRNLPSFTVSLNAEQCFDFDDEPEEGEYWVWFDGKWKRTFPVYESDKDHIHGIFIIV